MSATFSIFVRITTEYTQKTITWDKKTKIKSLSLKRDGSVN